MIFTAPVLPEYFTGSEDCDGSGNQVKRSRAANQAMDSLIAKDEKVSMSSRPTWFYA